MAKTETIEKPSLYVVRESFVVEVDGVPIAYRKGDDVQPDDPIVRTHQTMLGPWVFAHPVVRRARIHEPEVRAE